MPSIAKWYQCMYTYVTALMIVGGRLSAGLLLNHITVMGQILEQLALKKDVAFKDAFLVCCLFPRFSCICAFCLCRPTILVAVSTGGRRRRAIGVVLFFANKCAA